MRNRFWVSRIWSYVFLVVIFVYLISIFSRTVWKNYLINRQIYKLQKELEVVEEENLRLKNLVAYYQSEVYQERIARSLLNYKGPDEKVVAFSYKTPEKEEFKFKEPATDSRTNLQKWYDFIFRKS